MPLVNSDLQATWESLYGPQQIGETGVYVHFDRAVKDRITGNIAGILVRALNLQPGQSIGIIGAGFGWVAEDLFARGLSPIVAVDTSAWIQSNKTQHATVTILNEDGGSNASRGRIRQALGLTGNNRATWCISEDVLPILSDAEAQTLDSNMRLVGTSVAHLVSELIPGGDQDSRLNWKTKEQWKALLPSATIISRQTGDAV
jgi:hypothetical protein